MTDTCSPTTHKFYKGFDIHSNIAEEAYKVADAMLEARTLKLQ